MKQQLYINGVAVDMATDEIKIKVASNALTRADKTMTAHSYNVTLPRTATNDTVFGMAYVPAAETGGVATHRYHEAALYFDGVPLFEGGKAVLTAVDDKGYNVTLLWGLVDVFDEIKREGLDLCDLPMSEHWVEGSMATWGTLYKVSGVEYNSGMDDGIYATLTADGKAEADKYPWAVPWVRARAILDKIAQVYGITWDFSTAAAAAVDTLVHPLTTLRSKCDDEVVEGWLSAMIGTRTESGREYTYMQWGNMQADNMHIAGNVLKWGKPYEGDVYAAREVVFKTFRVHGYALQEWELLFAHTWVPNMEVAKGQVITIGEGNAVIGSVEQGLGHFIDVTFHDVRLSAWPADDEGSFPYPSVKDSTIHSADCSVTADWVLEDVGDMVVGDDYCEERNYPAVGVMQYISEVLAHCGAFLAGSVTRPSSLRVVTLDEVAAATPVNVDTLGVGEVSMTLDDLARRNVYSHVANDDDGTDYTASGTVEVDDTTLAVEAKAFESKFKVPRSNIIKSWHVEPDSEDENKNTAQWEDNGPYICGRRANGGGWYFGNTGQDFASVLANRYRGYSSMVLHPKVVECTVRMGVLELLGFDMERPLYVNQLGRAYIVVSIESDSGDNFKITMVQI